MAVPKTTIKRCRNYSNNGSVFCHIHGKITDKNSVIQLYNGISVTFGESEKDIKSFTNPIYLWKKFNKDINKIKTKNLKKIIDNQSKMIRNGTQNKVVDALVEGCGFSSEKKVLSFFQDKKILKLKPKDLEKARNFLGIIYYFNRHPETLVKLQIIIRIKLRYGKNIKDICKIQKWYRFRKWYKSLPVNPQVMRKYFIPNTNKIILVQRKVKQYINKKIKHSHNCPYSMEDYWLIPKKYRVVYKYYQGDSFHWRYYDIRWLHSDLLAQTYDKRFVIEPATRTEFPEDFVEEVARKIWVLTRIENDYEMDDEKKQNTLYIIENDWINRFKRRSLYRFSLMVLDLCHYLDMKIENIKNWRKSNFKLKYQIFYLQVMPAIKNIISNTHLHHLEEDLFYITRDMFKSEFLFPDTEISDELAGDAIYGILRIIINTKQMGIDIYNIVKDIMKENIQTLLMV
jgi:hypothetical protein